MGGTHFDWTLSEEARLSLLVNAVSTEEMISQLVNNAPAIASAGMPAYNWLNDNEHGLKQCRIILIT